MCLGHERCCTRNDSLQCAGTQPCLAGRTTMSELGPQLTSDYTFEQMEHRHIKRVLELTNGHRLVRSAVRGRHAITKYLEQTTRLAARTLKHSGERTLVGGQWTKADSYLVAAGRSKAHQRGDLDVLAVLDLLNSRARDTSIRADGGE